jgi:phytoene desaturase
VYEKTNPVGGRARQKLMVTFDMGPSWYWMPDVLIVFADFGKTTDYYELIKLFQLTEYFGVDEFIATLIIYPEIEATFEK